MMTPYPQRESHFAHRFVRLLTRTAAAMEIGADGCWLLTIIVMQEDSCRYTRPVNFYLGQLCALMAIPMENENQLRRIRSRCVEAGWLQYDAGTKRKPGRYFVAIPKHAESIPDGPCDDEQVMSVQESVQGSVRESVRESCENRAPSVRESCENRAASIPLPIPNPRERETRAPATEYDEHDIASVVQAVLPMPVRVSPIDLPHLLRGLHLPPADRPEADVLLRLYGHEAMETAWPALTGKIQDHRIPPAKDPKRVWLSELRTALQGRFVLDPEDYHRAGLPVPQGASHA